MPYSPIYVAGKSDLEVSEALRDCISVKTRLIVTTICVCLLLGVPEVHTKFQFSSLIFFLFKHVGEGPKRVYMSV